MIELLRGATLVVGALLLASTVPAAGGSNAPKVPKSKVSPKQMAVEAYNRGIAARDQAWALTEKMEASTEQRERDKLAKKIDKSYRKALGRVEQAKEAYMQLFEGARPLADQLLAAMKLWVSERTAAGEDVEAMAAWVGEREEIASQTRPVSRLGGSDW